ncbi:MAG: YciI family protein [Pirellulaceae bacterium]|nr:YciI family protein [Pirellulaceae bacterium]
MQKYMLIYRGPAEAANQMPSPEEMEAIFKQWNAWKEEFKASILDMGDGLKPEGRVLQSDGSVTDGPYIEAKEVLGGFSIVQAESYEGALEIARACPIRHEPGSTVEIRELFGF